MFIRSKKDVAVRQRELLEAVSPPMLEYLCENARAMVMDKACSVAVSDILGSAVGDLRPAMEAVARLAAEDFVAGGVEGQVCYGSIITPIQNIQVLISALWNYILKICAGNF